MKNKPYSVYKHTSPTGNVYIGITCQKPRQRWGTNGQNYRDCPKFWHAICKYGWGNFQHEILYTGLTPEDACRIEIKLISEFQSKGISYNTNYGGEGSRGHKVSDETKKRLREFRLGKPGNKLSAESRKLIALTKMGSKNPMFGKPASGRKKLYMYSIDGKLIEIFNCVNEAVNKYDIPAPWFSTLKNACRLRMGVVWSFGKFSNPTQRIHKQRRKPIKKIQQAPSFDEPKYEFTSKDPKACIVIQYNVNGTQLSFATSGRMARDKFNISLGCLTAHKNKAPFFHNGAWYQVISRNL